MGATPSRGAKMWSAKFERRPNVSGDGVSRLRRSLAILHLVDLSVCKVHSMPASLQNAHANTIHAFMTVKAANALTTILSFDLSLPCLSPFA